MRLEINIKLDDEGGSGSKKFVFELPYSVENTGFEDRLVEIVSSGVDFSEIVESLCADVRKQIMAPAGQQQEQPDAASGETGGD